MSKQETMHRAWAETRKRFNSAKKGGLLELSRIVRIVLLLSWNKTGKSNDNVQMLITREVLYIISAL